MKTVSNSRGLHIGAGLLLLLGACTFNEQELEVYPCSPEYPQCPAGYTCNGTKCVKGGGDGDAGDAGIVDSGPVTDIKVTDQKVSDTDQGPKPDGPESDLLLPDGPLTDLPVTEGPNRKTGEITSGAARSTGGAYTLQSQVGHGIETKSTSGGTFTLRWSASVIPW